jgi:GxxExxY protein
MKTNSPNDTNDDKILHKELSYRVMEAVFAVHNELGPGFTEVIYQEALIYELQERGIPLERLSVITRLI